MGWGLQGENLYNAGQELPLLNLVQRSFDTLGMELSKSPLWTPLVWVLTIRVVWRNFKAKSLDFSLFLTLFYWSFMAPFMISKIKMPHWPVPIYPVAAVLICLELAAFGKNFKIPAIRYQKHIFVICALFLALAPLNKKPAYGRGEEFAFHQTVVKNSHTPLLFVTDKYPIFYAQTYAAWYFGSNAKINYISSEQLSSNPCEQDLLWLHPDLSESFKSQLEIAGWKKSLHQTRGVDLYQCTPLELSK